MSEELSLDQRIQLLAATDDVRLEFFVKSVKEHQSVWSLSNEEGFVMVETDDGDCVMVWPDADFAAQWAVEEWDDCEPVEISFETFTTLWLPSLEKDNITLAVFPNIEDEGKLTTAAEMKELLGI
ncbi:DUF2750 domain-containing protein [Marinomonas piezotolerans]|uniref:DUF2750 domain-containing protein n=1 Tax=Marinomonas piezotolerans TaxID=2213058 RepID=A0A370U860_9GAMM|nr:DUF2750 domain-containing protein [Marinomonas piezotolerans]RDL43980.1 DUF2750 domain-containing protein [Marinomonas piezotolerans]